MRQQTGFLRGIFRGKGVRMKELRVNDCLRTPYGIYSTFGRIDLDPCAGENTEIGIRNYALERGENGLELEWDGFVYCNPPFSQKELWIKKMMAHGEGILLLPERGSAPWCGPLAANAQKYFTMGKKINFEGGSTSNPTGSYLFLFGETAVKRIIDSGLPGHLSTVEFFRPRQ